MLRYVGKEPKKKGIAKTRQKTPHAAFATELNEVVGKQPKARRTTSMWLL